MRNFLSMALLFAAAATFVAAQPGTEHSSPGKTYVGTLVKGPGDAMIGVVTQGETFLAYLCSNDDEFNASHARWFRGKIGEQGNLGAEAGGVKLAGRLAAGQIEGTVTGPDKQALAFMATVVQGGALGGVFRAETIIEKDHIIAGWVRNDDGATVGNANILKGKQTPLKNQAAPKAKAPPQGLVGLGKDAKKLTGTAINELSPPLPGQLLGATVAGIDAKKNLLILKTDDGKSLTVPGDRLFSTDANGKRSRENLGTPTPFLKLGGHLHISRKCTSHNPKTGECDGHEFDISFTFLER